MSILERAEHLALQLAELEHLEVCGKVHADDWHIRNDYLPRHRRAVAAEMASAAREMGVAP